MSYFINPYTFANTAYDSRAQALFTAIEGGGDTLTTAEKTGTNQWFLDMDNYGLYTKVIAAWLMIGSTAGAHKWNAVSPLDTNGAYRLTWNGGWTHSSTGALPNGSDAYASTHMTPAASGITQNDVSISYYSRTSGSGGRDMGTVIYFRIILKYSNGFSYYGLNDGNGANTSGITSTRLFTASRTSSSAIAYYRDGTSIDSQGSSTSDGSFMTYEIELARADNEFGSKECAFACVMSSVNATQAANLATCVNSFQLALTRNV